MNLNNIVGRRRDLLDLVLRTFETRSNAELEPYQEQLFDDLRWLVGSEDHPVMGILEQPIHEISPETKAELDGLSYAAGVTDRLAGIHYEVLVDSNQLEDTHAPTPYVPSPDRAWERPPPGHPEDAEDPWWAHGTKETNPHWPYEGPAQGWVQA